MCIPHPFYVRDNAFWDRTLAPHEQPSRTVQPPELFSLLPASQSPHQRLESLMMEASWSIRQKPDWVKKLHDKSISAKWRMELEQQNASQLRENQLSAKMIDYLFVELETYAKLVDPETGIRHAGDDFVFWSDRLISNQIKTDLLTEVAKLENVPEDEKDWHPGSNKQVLDLVHPSLYPIVYGSTHVKDPENQKNVKVLEPDNPEDPYGFMADIGFWSKEFCWLPSDFAIDPHGKVKLASPYINNIHPFNKPLINVIEMLVGAFVPMWERVIGVIGTSDAASTRFREVCCLWPDLEDTGTLYVDEDKNEESDYAEFPGNDEEERRLNWLRTREDLIFPDIGGTIPVPLPLESAFQPSNLKNSTIQVIVKLANIHLTPENPEYEGGNWHVEGMLNERIVSTGIYYYDSENTTESQLSFRVCVDAPPDHAQHHYLCMDWIYNFSWGENLVQNRSSFSTKRDTCLAFPNIYQHRVSPFKLLDPTRPGHRKIVALFLVDPTQTIPSATNVPMQQKDYVTEVMTASLSDGSSLLNQLPAELKHLVIDNLDCLTRQEAEEYREKLIRERSNFGNQYDNDMTVEFNFCEH